MNRSQKALVTKELQQASASLSSAFKIVACHDEGNAALMKRLRYHQKLIGEMIVAFNGGPVLSIAEMVAVS